MSKSLCSHGYDKNGNVECPHCPKTDNPLRSHPAIHDDGGWGHQAKREAELAKLRAELDVNAKMLAKQCDLAREAETECERLRKLIGNEKAVHEPDMFIQGLVARTEQAEARANASTHDALEMEKQLRQAEARVKELEKERDDAIEFLGEKKARYNKRIEELTAKLAVAVGYIKKHKPTMYHSGGSAHYSEQEWQKIAAFLESPSAAATALLAVVEAFGKYADHRDAGYHTTQPPTKEYIQEASNLLGEALDAYWEHYQAAAGRGGE